MKKLSLNIADLTKGLDLLKQEAEIYEKKCREYHEEADHWKEVISDLKENKNALEGKIKADKKEVNKKTQEIAEITKRKDQVNKEYHKRIKENEETNQLKDKLDKEIAELKSDIKDLRLDKDKSMQRIIKEQQLLHEKQEDINKQLNTIDKKNEQIKVKENEIEFEKISIEKAKKGFHQHDYFLKTLAQRITDYADRLGMPIDLSAEKIKFLMSQNGKN